MNNPSCQLEHDLFLKFKNHSIRVVMLDGVPHFLLADVCAANGYRPEVAKVVDHPDFPAHAKRVAWEVTEEGHQDITVITPVGAWLFTVLTDAGRGQSFAAWARREAKLLCPNPADKDPAMCLTLGEDGSLPPCPMRYSGRRSEWDDLRFSQEYVNRQVAFSTERLEMQTRLLVEAQVAFEAKIKAAQGQEVAA